MKWSKTKSERFADTMTLTLDILLYVPRLIIRWFS